uniref:Small ribosomal subunit protein uS17c n=1 Tax=Tolypiocladia glomerulata TaxID=860646 RepID=A0A1Z1MUM8_9FLOR|nr:ribosomal protein S17 [Tolypiocladia glomerulata]ARW69788.1 ribosomal protein S17 [Tolypiocladia glomerulata]
MAKKETSGIVVSNKMNKTVTVIVRRPTSHKKYSKVISKTSKYYVDDPMNICEIGDQVRIQETRPISKNKRWIIIERTKVT